MTFDVAIIGGGPGGYVAAIKAAQKGLKTVLFEKGNLGGVCLNEGCIPTKALLKSAEILDYIKDSEEYGIELNGYTYNYKLACKRKDKIVKKLVSGIESLLHSNGVKCIKNEAKILTRNQILAGGETYEVKNIIIASGSKPAIPPVKGIESDHVITSTGMLNTNDLPKSIVVIGGGVIGAELSFLLASLDVEVTIIEMMDSILNMADRYIIETITKILVKKGVKIICSARVKEVLEDGVVYVKENNSHKILSEKVLVSVGRIFNTDIEELNRLGISHDRGKIITNEHMQTNIDGIYAIGDVNGKYMLAHVASKEGEIAVDNITGNPVKMSYKAVPQCVYTSPEIAWVGLTEQTAEERGLKIKTSIFPMAANGKSLINNETNGFVKIVADTVTDEVYGAHFICDHATDMISEISLGMNLEVCAQEIAQTIHPHPTISETVMECAEGIFSKPVHVFNI
jgi:dihydrolipoamide dehydrogenase